MSEKGKTAPKKSARAPAKKPACYADGFQAPFADMAFRLALLGSTDEEIAAILGISPSGLYKWRTTHPEFAQALDAGKHAADSHVAHSLYQRALGYEHDEVDVRVVEGQIVQTPIRKKYAPDTTACIFWLKNRARAKWRDKVEAGITDAEGNDVKLPDDAEVARRIAFILARATTVKGK